MAEVTMPRLSDTMEEGSVQRWLKQPGDTVTTGDIIAEIETDKAVMELEAYESGTLQQILVPEGEVVPIGRPIAMIGEGAAATATAESAPPATGAQQASAEEGAPTATTRTTEEAQKEAEPAATPAPQAPAASAAGNGRTQDRRAEQDGHTEQDDRAAESSREAGQTEDGRMLATPVARRMAEEWGIDLRRVRGTGPGGRILRENVEEFRAQAGGAAAQAQPTAAPTQPEPGAAQPAAPAPGAAAPPPAAGRAGEVEPLSRMRRAIAVTMSGSKPGIPHFYIDSEVDMGEAMKLRAQINDAGAAEVKISVNDLIVKAVARALRGFPQINSSYATGADGQAGVIRHEQINVSVATALEDGLLAPVVRDADKKSLSTVSAEIQDMAARAREGRIRQNELEEATFQVSNLGMFDVFAFISVITPPQAASLAIGSVRRVPVVQEDGQLGVGQMMHIVLSADHRVTDGATGARFLQEVKRLLQTPLSLIV